MRYVKSTLSVALATVLLTAGVAVAQDMNPNRTTQLTFSGPVEIPGMTLAAGTYTFRMADPRGGDRNTIQVLDANGQRILTTVHAIPARRLHIVEENVVTFRESAAAAPPAIRFWYYPNDIMGQEFAYPKDQAMLIAKASGESVLAVEGTDTIRVSADTEETAPAPVQAPETTVAESRPTNTTPVGTSGRRRLPQTSSALPLVGLMGLLALGGALLTRAVRHFAA